MKRAIIGVVGLYALAAVFLLHSRFVSACMICRTQWISFQGHCYLLVAEDKTFDEAEAHCREMSRHGRESHLMSIHSQAEHDFLLELITAAYDGQREKVWFGYRLDRVTGSYYWLDGSPLGNYTNWNLGEPSDENGREDCGQIFGDKVRWNDSRCGRRYGFACKTARRP